MAAREDDRPLHCHVCLDGNDEAEGGGGQLVHGGCGCRGSAGFAHLPCLIEAATHNPAADSWSMHGSMCWSTCPTCRQRYTGPASLGLARARDRQGSTSETKINLANALSEFSATMREWAEARRLYEEVVAGFTAQLGPAHVDTLATKNNLALLLMQMGERAEARRMYEEVVAGLTAQLGPAHTTTLKSKGNLATLLDEMGEGAEARRLLEEV